MKRMMWTAVVPVAALVLGACGESTTEVELSCPVVAIPTIAGDTVTLESNVRYIDIEVGTGAEIHEGSIVTAHYVGYLLDGTRFGSSIGGPPITFRMSQVIPGFAEGVSGMRIEGVRRLIIPSQLGYGTEPPANSCIPANATLIFDVEVLAAADG
jgi:peptidylprolyl isomerase